MGEICLRCDGLAGPCMVLFGAAWVFWRCMYKYWTLAVMYTRRNQFAIPLTFTFCGNLVTMKANLSPKSCPQLPEYCQIQHNSEQSLSLACVIQCTHLSINAILGI